MAQSIKLNNNNYIDSTGITHNRELLSNIIDTNVSLLNGLINNKTIYDSGSNNTGSYIRFTDGTMVCYRTTGEFTIDINNAWGSIYYGKNTNQWNYAKDFISTPVVIYDVISSSSTGEIKAYYEAPVITNSYISNISVGRPVATAGVKVKLWFIAIGKWK